MRFAYFFMPPATSVASEPVDVTLPKFIRVEVAPMVLVKGYPILGQRTLEFSGTRSELVFLDLRP